MVLKARHTQYNTFPGIIHAPGPLPPQWSYLNSFLLPHADKLEPCEELTLYTWNSPGPSTHLKPPGAFEKSCGKVPVEVLKSEKSWSNFLKTELLYEALKTCKTPYFLASDSSDSVIVDQPKTILSKFKDKFEKAGAKLVFQATGRWPDTQILTDFAESIQEAKPHFLKYLGAGSLMGRVDLALEFYKAALDLGPVPPYTVCDNIVIKTLWPEWYDRGVRLDYTSEIFAHLMIGMDYVRPVQPHSQTYIDVLKKFFNSTDKIEAAEIGCFYGENAESLLRTFHNMRLWVIDSWLGGWGGSDYYKFSQNEMTYIMHCALFFTSFAEERRRWIHSTSEQAHSTFRDGSLDTLFVDGDHFIVYQELKQYYPKIKSGGILAGHDYHPTRSDIRLVKPDVDSFCREYGLTLHLEDNMVWWAQKP